MPSSGQIEVSVDVTNSGDFDGEEVVQLYIRDVVGSVSRPLWELKGFRKISLAKGATQKVSFTLSPKELSFYNYDLDFVAEPGIFQVFVGGNSNAELSAEFEL
jgi:beta-glucosidase